MPTHWYGKGLREGEYSSNYQVGRQLRLTPHISRSRGPRSRGPRNGYQHFHNRLGFLCTKIMGVAKNLPVEISKAIFTRFQCFRSAWPFCFSSMTTFPPAFPIAEISRFLSPACGPQRNQTTSFAQKQWVEKGDFRKVGPV